MRGDELDLLRAYPEWAVLGFIGLSVAVWLVISCLVYLAKDGLFSDWAGLFHEEPIREQRPINIVDLHERRVRTEIQRQVARKRLTVPPKGAA